MKTIKAILNGLALASLLALTQTGFSQTAVSVQNAFAGINLSAAPVPAVPIAVSVEELPLLRKLNDAQLKVFLSALDATPQIPCASLPRNGQLGNFFSLQHPEWPPLPMNTSQSPVWQMNDSYLMNDINFDYGAADAISLAAGPQRRMSTAADDGFSPTGFGGGSSDGGDDTPVYSPMQINTNLVWLNITNVVNGFADLSLCNATNSIYTIWSTTNLATPFPDWQVETEVWPTNPAVMPFAVLTLGRQNLFLRAEDWTGMTTNGLLCWWSWLYFGNLNASASDLDAQGQYTLGDDFNYGLDPNIISFSVSLGNQHYQTQQASGQYVVTAGTPSYEAVLVNGTNFNNAVWQPYDGIVSLPLGATDGIYQVWLGLKGRAPSSTPTWIGTQVYLDRTPPGLTITNPVSGTVALPYIQLQGMANKRLASVTYDVSNALGVVTGQAGSVTGEYLDTNRLTFTTNYFQCYDVWLTNGINVITIHATDESGNVGSTSISYTQDYAGKTAPVIQLDWPADGMQIAQSNLTVRGTLSDPTASIVLQITDGAGNTNCLAGVVERDGHFWIQNVPLASGANELIVTAQDLLNNPATMSLQVNQNNDVDLTMNSVTSDLWESTATVSGTIGDASTVVTVNGMTAVNDGYGGWTVSGVPINDGNMAVFNAVATVGGGNLARFHAVAMNANNSQNTQAQLAQIKPAALKLAAATLNDERFDGRGGAEFTDDTTVWSWQAGQSGNYAETYHYWDTVGGNYTSWTTAPLLKDRSVPYAHFTDSYGDNQTNYYSLTGGWQGDFPQEIGSLLAISPEWADFWENKVGAASWILHTGGLNVARLTVMPCLNCQPQPPRRFKARDHNIQGRL